MSIMKKKIKAEKGNSIEEKSLEVEEKQDTKEMEEQQQKDMITFLSHPGQMNYQVLIKMQEQIEVLKGIGTALNNIGQIIDEATKEDE